MRGVLFDFGGTLNTDGDHWGAIFRRHLTDHFVDKNVDELEGAYIQSERDLVRTGLREETFRETLRRQITAQFTYLGGELSDAEALASALYREVSDRMERVRDFLRDLSARYRVGIVSNFYGNLDAVCQEFGITSYLSVIVDSALVGVRKPDPEIWQIGIRQIQVPADEIAVVGDSWKNDIGPTGPLGCTTIWYRGLEWRPASGKEEADYEVHSLKDLRSILLPGKEK